MPNKARLGHPAMKRNQPPEKAIIDFTGLLAWYKVHCDGLWEHTHGIKLETLDNPGWILTVDLIHTNLQGLTMAELSEGCSPDDHPVSPRWIHCVVRENRFQGTCDPTQVARLFLVFDELRASIGRAPT